MRHNTCPVMFKYVEIMCSAKVEHYEIPKQLLSLAVLLVSISEDFDLYRMYMTWIYVHIRTIIQYISYRTSPSKSSNAPLAVGLLLAAPLGLLQCTWLCCGLAFKFVVWSGAWHGNLLEVEHFSENMWMNCSLVEQTAFHPIPGYHFGDASGF